MIARLRAFGRFWYGFLVGDDWRIAAGVVAALALTYGVTRLGAPAWWIMPLAVAGLITLPLFRAVRRR